MDLNKIPSFQETVRRVAAFGPEQAQEYRNIYKKAVGSNNFTTIYIREGGFWVGITRWKDQDGKLLELKTIISVGKDEITKKRVIIYSNFLNGKKRNEVKGVTKYKKDMIQVHELERKNWFNTLEDLFAKRLSLEYAYEYCNVFFAVGISR